MKLGKIGFMGVHRRGEREIGKVGGRKSEIIADVGGAGRGLGGLGWAVIRAKGRKEKRSEVGWKITKTRRTRMAERTKAEIRPAELRAAWDCGRES